MTKLCVHCRRDIILFWATAVLWAPLLAVGVVVLNLAWLPLAVTANGRDCWITMLKTAYERSRTSSEDGE